MRIGVDRDQGKPGGARYDYRQKMEIKMIFCRKLAIVIGLVGGFLQAAQAGPVSDFEVAMRQAYGDYRIALFATNSGNADKSVSAIEGFKTKWSALAETNLQPPPQYADDPEYGATLENVTAILATAGDQAKAGELADAHETLEAIRDEIGLLHERNGIISFSDRMNAYHAKMEEILGKDYVGFDALGMKMLCEDVSVLGYLAEQIASHPPADASDPEFGPLLSAMTGSVAALTIAARNGDAAAADAAVKALKVPYSKLFLKFG
jgi:hypothetical protein